MNRLFGGGDLNDSRNIFERMSSKEKTSDIGGGGEGIESTIPNDMIKMNNNNRKYKKYKQSNIDDPYLKSI